MPCKDDYFDLWVDGSQAVYTWRPERLGIERSKGGR